VPDVEAYVRWLAGREVAPTPHVVGERA